MSRPEPVDSDHRTGPLVVVTGVSGSGKTTIGKSLARRLGVMYAEGDVFHPPQNVEKMRVGTPLSDADRRPWLDAISAWLAERSAQGGVITCSALKRQYRDRLASVSPRVFFVHLHGPAQLIADRMAARSGHFMPVSLLQSQLDTLEPLSPEEHGVQVSIDGPPAETTTLALAALRAQ
ncbi:gluconokinase [Streptomyces sp. NPDC006265]|uniref:gluconokinase n=1 Tax=Streptomyces sp. NPDC006265 TaxID=3156740 RepID=UPI0033AAE03E